MEEDIIKVLGDFKLEERKHPFSKDFSRKSGGNFTRLGQHSTEINS